MEPGMELPTQYHIVSTHCSKSLGHQQNIGIFCWYYRDIQEGCFFSMATNIIGTIKYTNLSQREMVIVFVSIETFNFCHAVGAHEKMMQDW